MPRDATTTARLGTTTAIAAPVRAGEPDHGPHLDRDGDGIGCEPYRGR
ncbi:excalibur calcium-binding domain-containing protein [Methyloversatilis sp. NSM2]